MANKYFYFEKKNPDRKGDCSCGKECFGCQAEKLSINCGSGFESKQFEFNIAKTLYHIDHEDEDHQRHMETADHHTRHRITKISHRDHEAGMATPELAIEIEKDLNVRFLAAFVLSLLVFLDEAILLKLNLISPSYINLFQFILVSSVLFASGSVFLTGALHSLRKFKLNTTVLVASSLLSLYYLSALFTFERGGEKVYELIAILVMLGLFCQWMELKYFNKTSAFLYALFNQLPPTTTVLKDDREVVVPTKNVNLKDIVVVKPGERIPVDGFVIEGDSTVDETLLTGVKDSVYKGSFDSVISGSRNIEGFLKFKTTDIGSNTLIVKIIRLVENFQNSKVFEQKHIEKFSGWLSVFVVLLATAIFFFWYGYLEVPFLTAFIFAVSVVLIASPDAISLAAPLVLSITAGLAAKHNIFFKDAQSLEKLSLINTIILDKNGTLAEGKPRVTEVISLSKMSEEDILSYALTIEKGSMHPIAKAIRFEAQTRRVAAIGKIEKIETFPGFGVRANIKGKNVIFGRRKFLTKNEIDFYKHQAQLDRLTSEGKKLSLLVIGKKIVGVIAIADKIKENSAKAIAELEKMGIELVMITGDHTKVADSIGRNLGIKRVFSEVLPRDKAVYVNKLKEEGKIVAMVGNGINDAHPLADADVSIAIGSGSDLTIQNTHVVLMKSDPLDIVAAIKLSRKAVKKMKQNLLWVSVYNAIAIPIAAGVLFVWPGVSIRPEIAILLASTISILIAKNSLKLNSLENKL